MQRQFLGTGLYLAVFSAALFWGMSHPDYDTRIYGLGALVFVALIAVLHVQHLLYRWVTHAMLATSWALVVWAMAYTGGIYSSKMIWLSLLLPVTYLLLPPRPAYLWSVIYVFTALAMAACSLAGWVSPPHAHEVDTVAWSWLNRAQVMVMLLVCVHLYRHQHRRAMSEKEAYNHQLEETSQKLLQAQAHKDAFLAAVGHELRTPMNAILGLNGALRKQLSEQPDDQEIVDLIRHSTEQLLRVVNHILDFSRLQAGRLRLMPEPMALDELLEISVQHMAGAARGKGLTLRLMAKDARSVWIQADATRLQQILLNLLDNAVRFSSQGVITLSAQRHATYWRFEVRDQSVGIAPERQAHIFRRFEHADTHTHLRYGGTGLGLTICEQLVRLHGGRIGVQSQLGEGACFWIELPLTEIAPVQQASPQEMLEMRERAWQILLVDDNELNRVVASMMLKQQLPHATIAHSASAKEALVQLEAQSFDLVLMDIMMPEMDGMRATEVLRAQGGRNAQTPVLAMTAINQPEDRVACLAVGMNGLVSKPLRATELMQAMTEVLMSPQRSAP